MNNSTNVQTPPQAAYFLWSCDKVYHKQEVCFLLYFLGQIVSWQYNPNLFGLNLTMYSYKWSWLTVMELSIVDKHGPDHEIESSSGKTTQMMSVRLTMHSSAKLNLLPFMYLSCVRVIKFITIRKYAFFCMYKVRLSLIHWIKIDLVLL